MQPTNQPSKQRSRCLYCGSLNRGKGCRYGPHNTHFHAGDETRCSYCGSTDYGRGCKVNPVGDLHLHGVNFGEGFRKDLQSYLDNEVLLKELKKEFTDFKAYKLKIIDEHGNKIKVPITEEEHSAYSPLTKTIIRLKKFLGPKIELLEAQQSLVKNSVDNNVSLEKYRKITEYRQRIEDSINELYKTINEACNDGFSVEEVKKLIKT
jgi:hypothetical protein